MSESHAELLAKVDKSNEVWRSVLKNVKIDQLDNPTVNDDWNVRLVISHLIWGNHWTEGYLTKGEGDFPVEDAIGDKNPLDVYDASYQRMVAAANVPGNMDRPVTMHFGETTASTVASFRISELLHHAWDLAKATGQDTNLAPEMSAESLAGWKGHMETEESRMGVFKMATQPPANATPAEELAAYLGKQVR